MKKIIILAVALFAVAGTALAQKAANDLEFRKYAQDQTFQSIVK